MKKKMRQLLVIVLCLFFLMPQEGKVCADIIDDGPQSENNTTDQPQVSDKANVYDLDSFMNVYQDEFKEYQEEFKDDTDQKKINLWEYPYSDKIRECITDSFSNLSFKYLYHNYQAPDYLWGYVEKDNMKGWVCLNEPSEVHMGYVKVDYNENVKDKKSDILVIVIVLVLVLVAGTGALIYIIYKKKT